MHQVGNWLRLKIQLLETGPLAFATIHEQQFSLPHYCVNCDLPSVASAAQTKVLMVQKLPVKRLQQLLFSTFHFVELHCRAEDHLSRQITCFGCWNNTLKFYPFSSTTKWLFIKGYECKCQIPTTTEFLKSCQDETYAYRSQRLLWEILIS